MVTHVYWVVLQAALRRDGVWLVDVHGNPTKFYHRQCFMHLARIPVGTVIN